MKSRIRSSAMAVSALAVFSRAASSGMAADLSVDSGEKVKVTPEIEAEVVRLFHAEKWKQGTIAAHFGLHYSTIYRILNRTGLPGKPVRARPSKADKYFPFIHRVLEKYPKLNATRLYHMVTARGYSGGIDHFRDIVRKIRPAPRGEAYLRLRTLRGEEAQVDWGFFGKIKIGNAERRLLAFVMVLSWSRRIFLRFYLGESTANFLRGHVEAFEHFGGVPREIKYDNLKSAVIERVDSAIRFNTDLLQLAAHYRFAPKPVPPARPTSKGRVERSIQYIRSSFFSAREFHDISDLNNQATAWCLTEAINRQCPEDKEISVQDAFEMEKPSMLHLPDDPFPVRDRKIVHIGKSPYFRFDGNDYSVPHRYVRRAILVEATLEQVKAIDGAAVIAAHSRSFARGQTIENQQHIEGLEKEKRAVSRDRGMNRILNVVPSSKHFYKAAAERGLNMGRLTQLLIRLLDLYGAAELEAALIETLASGAIHSYSVQNVLERRRATQGLPPPIAMKFLRDPKVDQIDFQPKSLDKYDQLLKMEDDEF